MKIYVTGSKVKYRKVKDRASCCESKRVAQ